MGASLIVGCYADMSGLPSGIEAVDGAQQGELPDSAVPSPWDDAGTLQPGSDAASGDADAACELTGNYAFLAELDVSWDGTSIGGWLPVIAPGSDKLKIATLMSVRRSGAGFIMSVKACDARVPSFASESLGEFYEARFPVEMWDQREMPSWDLKLNTQCREPGCAAVTSTLHALLGVDLDAPTGAWPADRNATGVRFPDHDEDNMPGLTLHMTRAGAFVYPPVNLVSWTRAKDLHLGIRVITRFDGKLVSCDRFEGSAPESKVETRAAGCVLDTLLGEPQACSSRSTVLSTSEADFLDGNLPKWHVTNGRWTGVRLPADATCSDVRAAVY